MFVEHERHGMNDQYLPPALLSACFFPEQRAASGTELLWYDAPPEFLSHYVAHQQNALSPYLG
jgi:hypothetical protein